MLQILPILVIAACGDPEAQQSPRAGLSATDILASDAVEGFLRVTEPRAFSFPQDHGLHTGYRNEWWYLTGNVETEQGRRFGYQATFFSSALRPEQENDCTETTDGWCTNHIWMGHAAVSDVSDETHLAAEIFTRQEPGLAGARLDPFRVWIQDWQLFSSSNDFPWELEIITGEFALTMSLLPQKPPALQGINGLSQKNSEAGNASYYYSLTRIETAGQIHLEGERFNVSGLSWLDREWSTSALANDQSGWDWFSLQLNNGTDLMYYQLRDLNGNTHPNSHGNMTSLMGAQTQITPDQVVLEELESWLAPDGTVYTTKWRMQIGDEDWIVQALLEDQLMDVTFQYWEGAVAVVDADSEQIIGQGYLEMVR